MMTSEFKDLYIKTQEKKKKKKDNQNLIKNIMISDFWIKIRNSLLN